MNMKSKDDVKLLVAAYHYLEILYLIVYFSNLLFPFLPMISVSNDKCACKTNVFQRYHLKGNLEFPFLSMKLVFNWDQLEADHICL